VDKVTGKGLSTEDYTTEEKTKLSRTPASCYGTTLTAAATAVKVVDGLPTDYTPTKGDFLVLKFLVASSASSPKVSINGVAYFLTWKTANLTASANYTIAINQTIIVQFNGASFEFLHLPDWSDDNYFDRISFGGNASVAGMAILANQICGIAAEDGKGYPLYNNTTKVASDKAFKLDNNYFLQTAALAINASFTTGAYQQLYTSNATNVPAMVGTLVAGDLGKDLYLVGTISDGGFKLDNTSETSWRTTSVPTSEDGKIYIKLGVVGSSATVFTITQGHTPMWFKNGLFQPYVDSDTGTKTMVLPITDYEEDNRSITLDNIRFSYFYNSLPMLEIYNDGEVAKFSYMRTLNTQHGLEGFGNLQLGTAILQLFYSSSWGATGFILMDKKNYVMYIIAAFIDGTNVTLSVERRKVNGVIPPHRLITA
jgi:hypothetical protein